jgi:PAS domain S-box-containing protein
VTATRLILVEDDEDDALLMVTRLRRGGVDLCHETVSTADALRAALAKGPPDVVISDYNLPAFTAQDALRILKETGSDAPFILVSGQVGEETAAAMMKAGAHDFILKDRMSLLVPAVQRELRDAEERRHRREAEAALRDSERRFRLLAEHAVDIIFLVRMQPEPVLEYISPAVERIVGYRPVDLYADPRLMGSLVHEDDVPAFHAFWADPQVAPHVVRLRRRDGRLVWLELRAIAVRDEDGTLIGVEGMYRDITEQRLADIEHERMDRELRHVERLDSLGHLAGGIAHDFNNILAVISAYAQDVATVLGEDHPSRPDLDRIGQAASRAAALTRQLLIFSRLEPSKPEVLDLNLVVADTEQLLRRTIGEDITFTTTLAPDLPAVLIDRSRLEQVIVNLVVNARAAMAAGGSLTISSSAVGERVRLDVTDTGTGMSPEVASRAFEPFFTTKGPGGGTGLGLSTAYGAVTEAGGDITLATALGQGTTVTVLLPAHAVDPATADPTPPAGTTSGGESRRIVVVEDDDDVRDIVVRILTRAGNRVTALPSAVGAVAVCTDPSSPVDGLLTDVIMPGMSGPQLAEEVRAARPDLPVLFMSGYTAGTLPGDHHLAADAPLVRKPFTAGALLAQLASAIGTPAQEPT